MIHLHKYIFVEDTNYDGWGWERVYVCTKCSKTKRRYVI
jgi:hypothetical protein